MSIIFATAMTVDIGPGLKIAVAVWLIGKFVAWVMKTHDIDGNKKEQTVLKG